MIVSTDAKIVDERIVQIKLGPPEGTHLMSHLMRNGSQGPDFPISATATAGTHKELSVHKNEIPDARSHPFNFTIQARSSLHSNIRHLICDTHYISTSALSPMAELHLYLLLHASSIVKPPTAGTPHLYYRSILKRIDVLDAINIGIGL